MGNFGSKESNKATKNTVESSHRLREERDLRAIYRVLDRCGIGKDREKSKEEDSGNNITSPSPSSAEIGIRLIEVLRVMGENGSIGLVSCCRAMSVCREWHRVLASCEFLWISFCCRLVGPLGTELFERRSAGSSKTLRGVLDLVWALTDRIEPQERLIELLGMAQADHLETWRLLINAVGLHPSFAVRFCVGNGREAGAVIPAGLTEFCSTVDMRGCTTREAMRRVVSRLQPGSGIDGAVVAQAIFTEFKRQNPGHPKLTREVEEMVSVVANHARLASEWPTLGSSKQALVLEPVPRVPLGEFLGSPGREEIMGEFFRNFSFGGVGLAGALGMIFTRFRLPGEAQRIDRIMNVFARQFFEDNPTMVPNADAVYILAFSLIMLETEWRAEHVRVKLTRDGFIRNCRDIGIPVQLLEEVYMWVVEIPSPPMNHFQ